MHLGMHLLPLAYSRVVMTTSDERDNDGSHAKGERYHEQLLLNPPSPSDGEEESDEFDSNNAEFLEASLSSANNDSTESDILLVDEWFGDDNRDQNLPSDSQEDTDFEDLWSHVRNDMLNRREDYFEEELHSMDVEGEDVWFDVEEHFQLTENATEFSGLPGVSQCGNSQSPEENTCQKEKTDFDQEPLYKGANVSLGSVMVLLVLFVIRFNLTSEALGSLLSIITALLPATRVLPSSLSRFKKYFSDLKHPFVFHHYCSYCFTHISQHGVKHCTNPHCLKDLSGKGATSYFIEVSIINQLQTMFSRSGFYKDLQHRFNRKKQAQENIEDVYDGRLYRSLVSKAFSIQEIIFHSFLTLMVSQYLSRQKFLFGRFILSSTNYLITRDLQKKICFLRECGLEKKSQPCGHF